MLSIIVATSENNVIGCDNDLPWHLPNDLKFFKETTLNHKVVMGRKTFDSIGFVLPKRENFIVTTKKEPINGAFIINDFNTFLEENKNTPEEIFICGGETIYTQSLKDVERIYLTKVDVELEGDAFFPQLNEDDWNLVSEIKHSKDEKHEYDYTFRVYERKNK